MVERTEKIYVLYGSQTGNSEQAAKDLCSAMADCLSPSSIQKLAGVKDTIVVEPVHMQLDDFLELEHCQWTSTMVIITSSYGVGQAPLGCYRFRELCDAWLDGKGSPDLLQGLQYAMCGLGDSKYTTFFQNPTKIDTALQLVGAQRIGDLGKADASGRGDDVQIKVIERWMESIWPHLASAVSRAPVSAERLSAMQASTVALCRQINPDFMPEEKKNTLAVAPAAIVVALLAILVYYYAMTL